MSEFKTHCLRILCCALVTGLMLVASPVNAGLMTLITATANNLSFTSEWEWLFDNGTWATAANTQQLGRLIGKSRCKALPEGI